jgi:hypothetical protein
MYSGTGLNEEKKICVLMASAPSKYEFENNQFSVYL